MLSEVIESREPARTVTLKGSLSGVLPDVSRQVLTSGEAKLTWWEVGAEEPLAFLLLRRPLRVACRTIIVRHVALLHVVVIVVTIVHAYILRPTTLVRSM